MLTDSRRQKYTLWERSYNGQGGGDTMARLTLEDVGALAGVCIYVSRVINNESSVRPGEGCAEAVISQTGYA